jgi:hypothetical protein
VLQNHQEKHPSDGVERLYHIDLEQHTRQTTPMDLLARQLDISEIVMNTPSFDERALVTMHQAVQHLASRLAMHFVNSFPKLCMRLMGR